ncbi:MAG TPA: orotidine-5'-phosphate decarboxylase [Acidimicrobiales bacterium]|nr:orotidine-5'-phosphate decarboxylase [Acidimicrobiales bacterium]
MEVRDRLALALDVDDLVVALRLAKRLRPWFGVAKVGLELFTAAGPDAVASLLNGGYKVMLDLKLHDIPTTVRKSARVIGAFGVSYLTLHAHGGAVMLRAGVDGLLEGAQSAGAPVPMAVAVTILTSDKDAPPHILGNRVATAVEAGCGGLVCAAVDVREAKELAPRMVTIVPGIRMAAGSRHDQVRVSTPEHALAAGADLLVVGRAVTEAPDPEAAATHLTKTLEEAGA